MDDTKNIPSIREIRKSFSPPQNTNVEHTSRLTKVERVALFITSHVGTMGFFIVILTWTVLWLSWNLFGPPSLQFDPFPGFILWLFISNLIQLHLMPLIMVGQNIQGHHAELRAEHEYETSKKSEKEVETVLLHLEKQQELLEEILKRVEKLERT